MIASATNNDSISKSILIKNKEVYNTNKFYFYDKTVVFGNLPMNREVLYLRNIKMVRNIIKGYKIKKTVGEGKKELEALNYSVSEEEIKIYEVSKRLTDIERFVSSGYGPFSSRPITLTFHEMVYYLYNIYGLYGTIFSGGAIIAEALLIMFLTYLFGGTMLALLFAILIAALITKALMSAFSLGSTGGGQLCLNDIKFFYPKIDIQNNKGYIYNRMKFLIKKSDEQEFINYKIYTNGLKEEDFLNKYSDQTICSNHPRSFGIVGTKVFSPKIDTPSTKMNERANNLITFSKEKYGKLKGTKMFKDEFIEKSEKNEVNSINTTNLADGKINIFGRKNGLLMHANFGNYAVIKRFANLKYAYYKGKEYYRGDPNVLKGGIHSCLYAPDIRINAIGYTGGASTESNLPLVYLGGLNFDGKGILLFSAAPLLDIEGGNLIPNIIEYIISVGTIIGSINSKTDLLKRRYAFFPSLKTKLLGIGTSYL